MTSPHPLIVLLACALLLGCTGTSQKLNRVSVGMTKAEVVRAIGTPDSTSANAETELLVYHLASPKELFVDPPDLTRYFVRIKGGRVDSFGELGDFGSTGNPTVDVRIRNR